MDDRKYPLCVLLFSGKRKSGKDYFTDRLLHKVDRDKFVIIKISAPIKSHFSKTYNLNLDDLMSSGDYKENYRSEMIEWSDELRKKDAGVFCRSAVEMYDAASKPIWIVSDIRRKTDIHWFKANYGNVVRTVRIEASDHIRQERGWVFTSGVDDVASECDLDDFGDWDWKIDNNGDDVQFINYFLEIVEYLNQIQ